MGSKKLPEVPNDNLYLTCRCHSREIFFQLRVTRWREIKLMQSSIFCDLTAKARMATRCFFVAIGTRVCHFKDVSFHLFYKCYNKCVVFVGLAVDDC